MTIKKLYTKYFQKSRSFLLPLLGMKKDVKYPSIQSYLKWRDVYDTSDRKLVLTYHIRESEEWKKFLLDIVMSNRMFDEYHDIDDEILIISFDMHSVAEDYDHVVHGRYSKLSKLTKSKIRDFYGYGSPEWAYMEGFLFPEKHITTYSKILDVDEQHIRFTGELCDKPNLDKETLKTNLHGKINDVDKLNMEHRKDFQTDIS